ncbi:ras-related protein Rab-42a [Dunckerocampus dactyliophorus]|uniref:ras-related protein Rab-42a n=1 Tax=Dunckerocampus dactyliophorus TaxID=161453 RepID=UPI0024069A07|nr:ras-related protein Rab-42a [Dunckerocampus dactyliophorus]
MQRRSADSFVRHTHIGGTASSHEMDILWQYQFRMILLGDSTVGKSSLLKRFTDGVYTDVADPTVGVDFYARSLDIEPGVKIKLQLWDTAGQERFRSITTSYYRNSVGGLLVFDLTSRKSFEHVREWHQEVSEHILPHRMVFILIGHKSDLNKDRRVGRDEAEQLASELGIRYVETSAKCNSNVDRAFELLTRDIYELMKIGAVVTRDGWDGVKSGLTAKVLYPADDEEEQARASAEKSCHC